MAVGRFACVQALMFAWSSFRVMELYRQVKNVVDTLNPQPFDCYGGWPEAQKL
jgi:hypothetical protein